MEKIKNEHILSISDKKKLFYYHVILFFCILTLETSVNIIFSLSSSQGGKVLSSIFSKNSGIAQILLPYIVVYILSIVCIYLIFSLINTIITIKVSSMIKRYLHKKDISILISFFIVNVLFLLIVYLFLNLLYPYSRQNIFEFNIPTPYQIKDSLFIFFVICYFSLVIWSLSKNKNVQILFILVIGVTLAYNMWPYLHLPPTIDSNISTNQGNNVVIIGIDSLRPDHLKRNGYPTSVAPFTENFLNNAIVFSNSYTPIARTFPSWMSILTGKDPMQTGMRYNLIQRHYYTNKEPTLSKFLQKKYGFYSVHAMDETRFCNLEPNDGFDELLHPLTGVADFFFGKIHDYSIPYLFFNNRIGDLIFPFIKNNRAKSSLYDGKRFMLAIENKIKELRYKKHFFLAIHFCAAHWPYRFRQTKRTKIFQPHERYLDAIKIADTQVGNVLESLKTNGLYNNSIIILLSDHGESFDNYWGHGTSLHDYAQNHIVLGIKPIKYHYKNKEIKTLSSTVNIAPTIIDLLGYNSNIHFSKKSLFDNNNTNNKSIFLETGFHLFHDNGKGFTISEMINTGAEFYEVLPETKKIVVKDEYHQRIIESKQLAIQTNEWRLIVQKDIHNKWRVELFNITDINCQNDLAKQYPDIVRKLLPKIAHHFSIVLPPSLISLDSKNNSTG